MFSSAVCRLCMQENVCFLNIFESRCNSADENNLPDMIFKSACVQVEENDGLSQFMCILCKRELLRTVNFIAMVERSDFTFRHAVETFQDNMTNNVDVLRKNMTTVSEAKCISEDIGHLKGKLKFKAALHKALMISEKDNEGVINKFECTLDADYSSDDYYSDESMENIDLSDNNESPIQMFDESDEEDWTSETGAIVSHLIQKIEVSDHKISPENSLSTSHRSEEDSLQPIEEATTTNNENINVAFDTFESAFQELSSLVHIDEQMFEDDDTESHSSYHRKTLMCHLCGNTFRRETALEVHKKEHMRKHKKSYICNLCQRNFNSPAAFGAHYIIHTSAPNNRKEKYHCNLCEKTFKNPGAFGAHLRDHTLPPKSHKCISCSQSFRSISSLNMHQRVHKTKRTIQTSAPGNRKNFMCKLCKKSFENPSAFQAHCKAHNLSRRQILPRTTTPNTTTLNSWKEKCNFCETTFKNHTALRMHLRFHNASQRVQCDSCDEVFNSVCSLKIHRTVHNRENALDTSALKKRRKRSHCTVCKRSFRGLSSLKAHVKKRHPPPKVHKCDSCRLTFNCISTLKRHQSLHNKE